MAFSKWLSNRIQISTSKLESKSRMPASDFQKMQIETEIERKYGRSWDMNRAVGWIKINKALGGFSFTVAKAIPFSNLYPKKLFESIPPDKCVGGWHVITIAEGTSSDKILSIFKSFFIEVVSSKPFKGCFVDDTAIVSLYKFVDWNSLISAQLDISSKTQ